MTMKKPELLAPAGDLEKLKYALHYGADAVYLGGPAFGLRAGAGNFSLEEMAEGVQYAHAQGKKVYVTVNIFAKNSQVDEAEDYFLKLKDLRVDALIISDMGIFRVARAVVPELPVHISTQANTTNYLGAQSWAELGAKRVVLARENSLDELKFIKDKNSKLEIEAFVHGAMCMSYSGRCFLSAYMTGRSANLGECTHPCRWKYRLVEELRPGEYLPVGEDEDSSYIMSPADLCMIEFIPQLVASGIDSFKIEGRMKSIHYVATVVKAYREAIDAFYTSHWDFIRRMPEWVSELRNASSRPFNTGFYFGPPKTIPLEEAFAAKLPQFVGVVLDFDSEGKRALVEQRNRFFVGDILEAVSPEGENFRWKLEQIFDIEENKLGVAPHPKQQVYLPAPQALKPWSLLRRIPASAAAGE
jgi:U32 family peptidase